MKCEFTRMPESKRKKDAVCTRCNGDHATVDHPIVCIVCGAKGHYANMCQDYLAKVTGQDRTPPIVHFTTSTSSVHPDRLGNVPGGGC